MQHENAEAFRLGGFARQQDALHLLRVFAPLVAKLGTKQHDFKTLDHITYSCHIMFVYNITLKLATYRVLSLYNNATDMKAAYTETNVNATYSEYDKVTKNREPPHYFAPCSFSRV
jgi:hypothetical protein